MLQRRGKNRQAGFPIDPAARRYNLTDPNNWESGYPDSDFSNNVKQLLDVPGTDDMAGVFIRGIFKNEAQANACLRLMYRHKKFGDSDHQEMLRCKIASSAAINGVSRLDALFGAVNLLASDMYRTARGMTQLKKGQQENIVKGSDFRQDGKPPNGGLGVAQG